MEGIVKVTHSCGHEVEVKYGTISNNRGATERGIIARSAKEVCWPCRIAARKYELAKVCLDDPTQDGWAFFVPPTEAYIVTNERWNGWVMPYFTRQNADAVMAAWNKNTTREEGRMRFDEACDSYIVSLDDSDDEEEAEFEGEELVIDGQPIHVYGIGTTCFTWDLEPPTIQLTQWQADYAKYVLSHFAADQRPAILLGNAIMFGDEDSRQDFLEELRNEISYDSSCGAETCGGELLAKLEAE